MLFRILLFTVFSSSLFALPIDNNLTEIELLPHTQIYIDHTRNATIETVRNKPFRPVTKKALGFGYSPKFHVWIRFALTNDTDKPIHKILEYANPLTSHVNFYTAPPAKLLKKEGLLGKSDQSIAVNPTLEITLAPHTSRTYYIEAYSHVTTLLVRLRLYAPKAFYKKEIRHQFVTALFFGVMGIVILYNFIVFVMTQERSYIYYVLFFMGITLHHLIYKGIAPLYIIPQNIMAHLIEYSIFIVAFPAFFLALFMKEILALKRLPTINKILNVYLMLFPLLLILFSKLGFENFRNLPTMVLLCLILIILIIMMFKKNRYAYMIALGWFLFISSAIAMQLSSMGKYDLFATYPYYVEFALVIEAILFALVLSSRIKQLRLENARAKEKLYIRQKEEKQRLKQEVEAKTADLVKMVDEKQLLLKELNHRVKNNLQTILSFVRLQGGKISDNSAHDAFETLEHRILSINHLHKLLDPQKGIEKIDTKAYFSSIVKHLQESFQMRHIKVTIKTEAILKFNDALHCGIILNEAVTNAYQHAFHGITNGNIFVKLLQNDDTYLFQIKDSGTGYDPKNDTDSLGLHLIENLALNHLEGTFRIANTTQGTSIEIKWREKKMKETITEALAFGKEIVWPYADKHLAMAKDAEVLAEIFRLRSRIYTEMGYQEEFPDPVPGYNFDDFDTRSAIFYTHKNGTVTGTCRIVFDAEGGLPIDKNYSLNHLRGNRRRLAELSRFIIDSEVGGLSPEFKLLIKGMYGIIAYNNIDLAVTVIAKEHFRLYEKVGGFRSEVLLPTYGTLVRPYIIATWDTSAVSPFFKRAFLHRKSA